MNDGPANIENGDGLRETPRGRGDGGMRKG